MPGIEGMGWCRRFDRAIDSRLVREDLPACIGEHNGCGNCPECGYQEIRTGRGAMLDEQALRAHLRLHRDRNQATADREWSDYEDRDCDDPRRPEILSNYHGAKWATAAYTDLLRRLDAGEFRPAGHCIDTDRVHQEINQVIRVRLNDELYQEMWDRVQKDCPGLPKWTTNGILTDIFGMLLGRSCEFLFEDPPEKE